MEALGYESPVYGWIENHHVNYQLPQGEPERGETI
jgi:hypothetical protein